MADAQQLQRTKAIGQALWQDMERNKATWGLIGEYVYPWRNQCIQDNDKGDATRRSRRIINGAAGLAFNAFRAGMLAGNSSPDMTWFKMTLRDPELMESEDARRFLDELEKALFSDLARSNTYRALALAYGDQGLYGTSAMLVTEDDQDPLRCHVFPIGSYAIGQDYRGVPDKFYREFTLTAAQMRDQFGLDALSATVRNALSVGRAGSTEFDVCHLIVPNDDAYDGAASAATAKRFKECYYEKAAGAEGKYLRESGYDHFPVIVTRWTPAGATTPWGVGPGLEALGDIMQLQLMTRDMTNAVELGVNPPMKGPGALKEAIINRRPGRFTAVDVTQGQQPLEPLFPNTLRLDHVFALTEKLEARINEHFFKDLFRQFTGQPDKTLPKTAYLAQRIFQEKAGNLLPAMQQQYDELLTPLLDRAIQIRIATGRLSFDERAKEMFPDAVVIPQSLSKVDLVYDFVSPLAQAQRAMRTGGIETFLGVVGQASAVWPEARNKVDIYEAIEEIADAYSIPPKLVREAEEVAEIEEAQAQAMQQQQMAENIPQAAKAAKHLATAPVGEGNALEAILGAA